MVSEIGFSDTLTLAQTIGIVGTMALTLYFSKRHIQALSSDTETRVLNDLDKKIHNFVELLLERPSLHKVVDNLEPNASESEQYLFTYYFLSICSHAFAMHQRDVLSDAEWRSYEQWMRNSFQRGTISERWKRIEEDRWFDPAFQEFLNAEIIGAKTP
jgi:hypothetical protein